MLYRIPGYMTSKWVINFSENNSYRLYSSISNPELFFNRIGIDKFRIGIDKFRIEIDKFRIGIDKFRIGIDKFDVKLELTKWNWPHVW